MVKSTTSLDFERGQEVKKSMEIGVYAKYGKFYDLFIELHKIAKSSKNFKEVSEIFWNPTGPYQLPEPYFNIDSKLMGWESTTKESVPEQFVISLYKIYIACYNVLSGNELVVSDVNKFDQITRCFDEG